MGVSGQNQQFVTVCSMCSAILFPGHSWHLAGSRETIIVPFNPAKWRCHVVNRTAVAKPPISEGGI